MITVEELRDCKKVSNDLIQMVKDRINEVWTNYDEHNHFECGDFSFEYNGVSYDAYMISCSNWDDEGKYQYQDITYRLVSFDKSINDYLCNENIVDKFDLFLIMNVSRCGSYFSEYVFEYGKPIIKIATIERIPERVIPAHDEVKLICVSKEGE